MIVVLAAAAAGLASRVKAGSHAGSGAQARTGSADLPRDSPQEPAVRLAVTGRRRHSERARRPRGRHHPALRVRAEARVRRVGQLPGQELGCRRPADLGVRLRPVGSARCDADGGVRRGSPERPRRAFRLPQLGELGSEHRGRQRQHVRAGARKPRSADCLPAGHARHPARRAVLRLADMEPCGQIRDRIVGVRTVSGLDPDRQGIEAGERPGSLRPPAERPGARHPRRERRHHGHAEHRRDARWHAVHGRRDARRRERRSPTTRRRSSAGTTAAAARSWRRAPVRASR